MALRNTEIRLLLLVVLVHLRSWLFKRVSSHWDALRISIGYSEAQLHVLFACCLDPDSDAMHAIARSSTSAEFNKKDSQVSPFLGNYQQQARNKQAQSSLQPLAVGEGTVIIGLLLLLASPRQPPQAG